MHTGIEFPNIGIHLESVGDHISVMGFDIAYYGIIIGIGILAGIFIAAWEARRTGQKPDDYYDLAIYAVIFAIIGARIYYVIFSWDMHQAGRTGDLRRSYCRSTYGHRVCEDQEIVGAASDGYGGTRLGGGTDDRTVGEFLQPGSIWRIYRLDSCHAASGRRSPGIGYYGSHAGAYGDGGGGVLYPGSSYISL